MQWRTERGGYLREILTARVYDVAVRPHALSDFNTACYFALQARVVRVWQRQRLTWRCLL